MPANSSLSRLVCHFGTNHQAAKAIAMLTTALAAVHDAFAPNLLSLKDRRKPA